MLENHHKLILYTYKDQYQHEDITAYCEKNNLNFYNLSAHSYEDFTKNYKQNSNFTTNISVVVDSVLKDRQSNLIYLSGFVEKYPKFSYIVREDLAQDIIKKLYVYFNKSEEVENLFSGLPKYSNDNSATPALVKKNLIKNLSNSEIETLFSSIDTKLFGHSAFKNALKIKISSFIKLSKIKSKILSTFLLGSSGIGKTEIARIINSDLKDDLKLIKINFGNYTSPHSLNSLVGSPRGFIGSEEGELNKKLKIKHNGIILCDEFEKADNSIVFFFLELLEDGFFTDSQGIEYNLENYIIVFTSNLKNNEFHNKLPSEFISRLDLISEFGVLSNTDKSNYIDYQIKILIDKFKEEEIIIKITDEEIKEIKNTLSNLHDLRKIKKEVENNIASRFENSI